MGSQPRETPQELNCQGNDAGIVGTIAAVEKRGIVYHPQWDGGEEKRKLRCQLWRPSATALTCSGLCFKLELVVLLT